MHVNLQNAANNGGPLLTLDMSIYNTHGFIAINYLLIFSIFNLIFKST